MPQHTTGIRHSQAYYGTAGDTEPDREGGSNIIDERQHTELSVQYL